MAETTPATTQGQPQKQGEAPDTPLGPRWVWYQTVHATVLTLQPGPQAPVQCQRTILAHGLALGFLEPGGPFLLAKVT
jgi:hypothetical protein